MIAHELRGPLAGILGNLSLLEHPRYQERQPELIRNLRRSAELMALTLANVAVSDSVPEVHFEPVVLAELFADADSLMRPVAEGKGIALTVAPDAPAVHGEFGLLRQVVLNLLTNAVRNTDAGGVTLSWVRAEEQVVVTLSDTGRGFDASRPLARHARDEGQRQGLGLGLFVSAAILEAHCSQLELVSSAAGTVASFRLEAV